MALTTIYPALRRGAFEINKRVSEISAVAIMHCTCVDGSYVVGIVVG